MSDTRTYLTKMIQFAVGGCADYWAGLIADCLLAHGVTVQEWIPVTERLPDADSNYIVVACDEGCPYGEGIWYDTVVVVAEYYHGSWTWCESGTEYDLNGLVTHWMPLPEPPKEG